MSVYRTSRPSWSSAQNRLVDRLDDPAWRDDVLDADPARLFALDALPRANEKLPFGEIRRIGGG